MNVTARERSEPLEEDLDLPQEEDRPMSLWFWIVPLLLLLAFLAFFFTHPRFGLPHPPPIAAASTLPTLGMVQFDRGKPTLTPDGQATLDRAADAMRGNPNVRLRLEGYDHPLPKHHRKDHRIDPLTLQRAQAVELYLDAHGIERSRLTGGMVAHSPSAFPTLNVDTRGAELYAQ